MSPIDDELRTALSSRTETVGLSPDFFTGVEKRARRMRRNRAVAAVAGSALAVSALGLGGPMLASTLTRDVAPPMASSGPTPAPSSTSAAGDPALDPAAPWAYRGDAAVLEDGLPEAAAREVAARYDAAEDAVALSPLFGQVYEPSGAAELVYVAVLDGGLAVWGVATESESGVELLVDTPLVDGTTALTAALPGDEVPRLLVVAAPEEGSRAEYSPDGADLWTPLAELAPGVAVGPLEGDPATDLVRVTDFFGRTVHAQPAPDPTGGQPADEGPGTETPVDVDAGPYVLDPGDPWAFRGDPAVADRLAADDERLFLAGGRDRTAATTESTPLFAGRYASGVSLVVVLHRMPTDSVVTTTWQQGDRAPQQSEQAVLPGTVLVQSAVPTDLGDESLVVVALASPEATAVESTVPERVELDAAESYAVWQLPGRSSAGEVFLYATGDGLLYHSEPARRS